MRTREKRISGILYAIVYIKASAVIDVYKYKRNAKTKLAGLVGCRIAKLKVKEIK